MKKKLIILFFSLMIFSSYMAIAQNNFSWEGRINWSGLLQEHPNSETTLEYLYFDDAVYLYEDFLPYKEIHFIVNENTNAIKINSASFKYELCTQKESTYLSSKNFTCTEINISQKVKSKSNQARLSFFPIRWNADLSTFEKVTDYQIEVSEISDNQSSAKIKSPTFKENSILKSGNWYKLRIDQSGVHKITYSDLESWGISMEGINPHNIQIYTGQAGMLPEPNEDSRIDDLEKIAIYVQGEEDNSFDSEDYILFYGVSANLWEHNHNGYYQYINNLYDNYNYYFLTTSFGSGDRITQSILPQEPYTHIVNSSNTYLIFEEDLVNLAQSGKRWLGEKINQTGMISHTINIPGLNIEKNVRFDFKYAHLNDEKEYLTFKVNNTTLDTVKANAISSDWVVARFDQKIFETQVQNDEIQIQLEFIENTNAIDLWLDNITINAYKDLHLNNTQFSFSDFESVGLGNISKYELTGSSPSTKIWHISNASHPTSINYEENSGTISFKFNSDSIAEFIAFNDENIFSADFVGEVANQDLHSLQNIDLLIVAYPNFLEEAERLGNLHAEYDNMEFFITTPDIIYNEFSSGKQDPAAIRDFAKLLFESNLESSGLKYLLLFGDGSFDPKDRIEGNTNFIPTFQTAESFDKTVSYVMDDFFGFLEDDEGFNGAGDLDIGIGRLPVKSVLEARGVVDKIEHYMTGKTEVWGSWQNKICFIADDEEGNLFFRQCDTISNRLARTYYHINQNKIYIDAYIQEKTTSGPRYPQVKDAINNQVEEGALIINYVGHGGERGWAEERILEMIDINKWSNIDNLPLFLTATCEFSRFDNPELTSGGELVILNSKGGGIGLITTTRLSYAVSNFSLNKRFFENAFEKVDGEYLRLGDLMKVAKSGGYTTKNIVLLGDPALKLAYPELDIQTTYVNGELGSSLPDTLNALEEVNIEGFVTNNSGHIVEDFNGHLYPIIFDKPYLYQTLNNDGEAPPVTFSIQDKQLFEGNISIENGAFSFSFIVPRDIISQNFDKGKISYFAHNDEITAGGFCNELLIGGVDSNAAIDNEGPEITLYLDSENFSTGEIVRKDPTLIAYLYDEHGINNSNLAIGHDITSQVDNYTFSYLLDDAYQPDIDTYKSGKIIFPLNEFENGLHTLTLKAFDSYNNSSEASIQFNVTTDSVLIISQVMNAPNPMRDYTNFSFNHPRPGEHLNITLNIFNINGIPVFTHSEKVFSESIQTNFYQWNGRSNNGQLLDNGLYIYRIIVSDKRGEVFSQSQRLIISR